jgi:hemolysin III
MLRSNGFSGPEWWSDAAVHLLGLIAALVGVPVLITLAFVWSGALTVIAATAIYGACLIALFAASAFNNLTAAPAWAQVLSRIDRGAIYLKIAGTYTPLAVIAGGQAGPLLGTVWGAALAGVSLTFCNPERVRLIALALYLLLGWAGLFVGGPLLDGLSAAGLALVFTGGGLYTLGIGFFLWRRLPFHTTIWHLFVLAGSSVFYAAILVELAKHAPQAIA